MRRILLGVASLAAIGTPAFAADLAPRTYVPTKAPPLVSPAYDWSGFYVGLNGGGGWNRNCWNNTALFGTAVTPSAGEGCTSGSGGTAGAQIGYRWQAASWVFGVETQGNWADISGSNQSLVFPDITNQSKLDAFGLFTGQIGYALNNVMLYVKGGAAVTDSRYSGWSNATGIEVGSASDTRWGGTVGVGIEYGFAPNWSMALEYDHLFMGTTNNTFIGTAPANLGINTRNEDISQDIDLVTARINYRFGAPGISQY